MAEVYVSFSPGWIHKKDSLVYSDSFSSIISFYLFGTPCDYVSSSGHTMSDFGWKKGVWKSPALRSFLMSNAYLQPGITYRKVTKLSEMSGALAASGLGGSFHKQRGSNRIAFYSDGSKVDIISILYYIRCAFAHGRFERYDNNGEACYAFEAITRKKGSNDYLLRARMMLSEETLILWMNTLTEGPAAFESLKSQFEINVQEKLKQSIKDNPIHKKGDLLPFFPYDGNVIYKQLKVLTDKGEVVYNTSKKVWQVL